MAGSLILGLVGTIAISLADGSAVRQGDPVVIEWRAGIEVVSRDTARLDARSLVLPAKPERASSFRIAGPEYLSRVVPIGRAASAELVLVRGAVLDVVVSEPGRLYVLETGSTAAEPETYPAGKTPDEGRRLLWPGQYAVVLDAGSAVPLRRERVELAPGQTVRLAAPSAPAAGAWIPLRVRASDEAGKPLSGVGLRLIAEPDPLVRLTLLALRNRSHASGADGRIDLGLVPRDLPDLRFARQSLRDAIVRVASARADEQGIVGVVLRPHAAVTVRWPALPKDGEGYRVRAERCRGEANAETCAAWDRSAEAGFSKTGLARFAALSPGWYRVFLAPPGVESLSYADVEVPWSSESPDPPEVVFEAEEWRFAGVVVDSEDRPVAGARVYAAPVVTSGNAASVLARARSGPAGEFELTFLGSVGKFGLAAEADAPPGGSDPILLTPSDRGRTDLRLVLVSGAVKVKVTSRRTDAPLEGCSLRSKWSVQGGKGQSNQIRLTGPDGTVTFRGMRQATIVVQAACSGFVPSTGTVVELGSSGIEETSIQLDEVDTVTLRVVDSQGRAVQGARAVVPDPDFSSQGFDAMVLAVGVTAPDGKLELVGDRYGNLPVFVLAPGRALGIGRLPNARRDGGDGETLVVLHSPSSFAGASATSASGRALPPGGLQFTYGGIVVPGSALRELAAVHGFPISGFLVGAGAGASNLVPAYLPPGEYEVAYLVGSKQTRAVRAVPAGFLRLPASGLVDFRVDAVP